MKFTNLFNILSVTVIFLLNINTSVLSQSSSKNDLIINDIQIIFNNMQIKIQNYLLTFASNTIVTNVNSILTVAKHL